MSAPLLVGLVGKKRAGKDSLAAQLVERHGFARVAFADPLKRAALAADPIIFTVPEFDQAPWEEDRKAVRLSAVVQARGWEWAKDHPEVRRTLQVLGVAIRELDADFWVRAGMKAAAGSLAAGQSVVITDVRFPNEADAILDIWEDWAAGVGPKCVSALVRVTRPGLPDDGDTHISEIALDSWPVDLTVTNAGSVEDLNAAADHLVETLIRN